MTDRQFHDAFTAAGGWFILTEFETVFHWSGPVSELVDKVYTHGFDSEIRATRTRVSNLRRIIEQGRAREALEKIRDSRRINQVHPDAGIRADRLLKQYG